MAGSSQKKERTRQGERVGPSVDASIAQRSSRASGAAGSIGSRGARVEQRSNSHSTGKQSTRNQASGTGKRAASGGKPAPRRSVAASPSNQPAPTRDARLVDWLRTTWTSMEPHHQQRVYGLSLLCLSLLLLGVLTVFRTAPILADFYGFFMTFFGWSAYLLAIGLIAFSVAHLVEGIRNQPFIRWSLVIGLILLWLIVLAESRLILRGETGGVVAALLVYPLQGWPPGVGHILLIGLFVIVSVLTFRITFGHVLTVSRFIMRVTAPDAGRPLPNNAARPSPYLGQRPQYSRYAGSATIAPPSRPSRGPAPVKADEMDKGSIEFEPDFEDAPDPLNDINIHKQQVGIVPKGARAAEPFNRDEHTAAVRGARQPPLPFNQAQQSQQAQQPVHLSANNASLNLPEMEELAPNPLKGKQAKGAPRGAAPAPESPWKLPDIAMLNHPEEVKLHLLGDDTNVLAKIIQDTLRSFRVDAEVRPEDISIGPTVIRFGIRPTGKPAMKADDKGRLTPVKDASGNIIYEARTRVSRIMALQNDLALVLEAKTIRMEAPVPGRPYVGVEIPNKNSRLVTLREVLESKEYQAAKSKSKLTVALGRDVAGAVRVGDLARMPHLLIAGATGAGKSVCINTIIASIVTQATPDDVRLLMVDPKMVELIMYNGIPHLLMPVVTEVEKVVGLLKNAIGEMERRYRVFSQLGVRNLDGYRKMRAEKLAHGDPSLQNLPAIVIIIDELADLMMAAPEEVEGMICRIAQLARATGIHLVVATQRPSVDVITGLIKANIPTRISFMVSSAIDSRTIIDMGGAERLLGRGDMLYLPADAGKPERIQGAFLADEEAERLVAYWRQQAEEHAQAMRGGAPNAGTPAVAPQPVIEPGWEISVAVSDEFELDDDLLDEAEQVVREYGRASISLLQRRLRIGYSRAARLIDLLEERGIIGPSEVSGRPREVYEQDSHGHYGGGGGEGRTMADEVEDIVAEEKLREELLKKQQQRNGPEHASPDDR